MEEVIDTRLKTQNVNTQANILPSTALETKQRENRIINEENKENVNDPIGTEASRIYYILLKL